LFGLRNLNDLPMADRLCQTKSVKAADPEETTSANETIHLAEETVATEAADIADEE